MRAVVLLSVLLAGNFFGVAHAQEPTVQIASRNQRIRAILLKPEKPVASVILLVGGHGQMDIAPGGSMKWGRGNQLVRTRASYVKQGFAVLVPDIAPDWKAEKNPKWGYRWNVRHGADIGALVAYMRKIAEPVVIVANSRAAVSLGVTLLVTKEKNRPDLAVMTVPMLMPVEEQPSFVKGIQDKPERAQIQMLIVSNKNDVCSFTLPELIADFQKWRGADKLDVVMLEGPQGTGHPCESEAAHGFAGIDDQVVETVSAWIKSRK